MQHLHAPWRLEYIQSIDKSPALKDEGCFLCADATIPHEQFQQRLVLWQSEHSVVLINAFPYTNGHLLVAPKAHIADLGDLSPEAMLDLQVQTVEAVRVLKAAISPQGFNVGINLGRAAGAGVPGHLHQHVVPRWNGDVNFMTVVGDVRIVPQAMSQLWEALMKVRQGSTAG